jgi:hypothetical protein
MSCHMFRLFRFPSPLADGGGGHAKPVLRSLLLLFFFFKEEQEEQTREVPAAQRFPRVPLAGTKRNKRHIP